MTSSLKDLFNHVISLVPRTDQGRTHRAKNMIGAVFIFPFLGENQSSHANGQYLMDLWYYLVLEIAEETSIRLTAPG